MNLKQSFIQFFCKIINLIIKLKRVTEKQLKRPLLIFDTIHTTHNTLYKTYMCVWCGEMLSVYGEFTGKATKLTADGEETHIYQRSENRQLIPHGSFIHCSSPIIHASFLFYFFTYLVETHTLFFYSTEW